MSDLRKIGVDSQQPLTELQRKLGSLETDSELRQFAPKALLMVQKGVIGPDLEAILKKYPGFTTELTARADLQDIVQRLGHSPLYLSRALAAVNNINYEAIYNGLQQSPIRQYLGDITVYPQRQPLPEPKPKLRVLTRNQAALLQEVYTQAEISNGFKPFSHNAQEYLIGLSHRIALETDPSEQQVLQATYEFYAEVDSLQFPRLRKQLSEEDDVRRDTEGRALDFPAPHQKIAIVRAAQEGSFADFDGMGSGKTAIGIGLAEYIGAKKVLVVSPAAVKDSWEEKIREYYTEDPGIARIDERRTRRQVGEAMYTIVNYDLLIPGKSGNGTEEQRVSQLVQELSAEGYDLLIIDEAQYIINANLRSDALMTLAQAVDRRLILTGTPIKNSPDDLRRIVHLLAPNEYPTPDALRQMGRDGLSSVFGDLMVRKTIRRSTEDLVELPPYCPETNGMEVYARIQLNPTQQAVYDAIQQDASLTSIAKIPLLRKAAIDHNLVRGDFQIPFDQEAAEKDLRRAYRTWKREQASGSTAAFDSDYLVTHGYKHLFLGANTHFKGGMDEFIQLVGGESVREVWSGVRISAKFEYLRNRIREQLAKGEKVVVYSGHFAEGITREIVDDVTGETIIEDLYSFLQREFPGIIVGRIDGELSTAKKASGLSDREIARRQWQQDRNCRILLTNIPSSSLGIDFTVNDGITTGVSIFGIDLPYTDADFSQMIRRVYRSGQHTPVHVEVLEAIGTIDEGLKVHLQRKRKVTAALMDGVIDPEIEAEVFGKGSTERAFGPYLRSEEQRLMDQFIAMRGRGVRVNGEYLEKPMEDGKTLGETIAELYLKYWEYALSGHTARLVRQVVEGLRTGSSPINIIADMGSGPLILERVLKQEAARSEDLIVFNVDMNKHMLDLGRAELERLGHPTQEERSIHASMSKTTIPDSVCDLVTCSLAFHYSSSADDRGEILAEANRVLRDGGYYILTFPDTYLTPGQYISFTEALRNFGFEVDINLSGRAEATDFTESPYSAWIVTARKVGQPTTRTLPIETFKFDFEGDEPIISRVDDKKKKGTGKKTGETPTKLVRHNRFDIIDPAKAHMRRSIEEALSRAGFYFSEDDLDEWEDAGGTYKIVQRRGGKREIILRRSADQ